jgi:hypothetical protein
MSKISYLVEGRETEKCWSDDASVRIVHGPAIRLGLVGSTRDIPDLAIRYFVDSRCLPTDVDHFVTVTEHDKAGNILGSRIFTASDFARDRVLNKLGDQTMTIISRRLVERGQAMGVAR